MSRKIIVEFEVSIDGTHDHVVMAHFVNPNELPIEPTDTEVLVLGDWNFIANHQYPKNEGEYDCLDKYGRIGKNLYANCGAPNAQAGFFDSPSGVKAQDIIAWCNDAQV